MSGSTRNNTLRRATVVTGGALTVAAACLVGGTGTAAAVTGSSDIITGSGTVGNAVGYLAQAGSSSLGSGSAGMFTPTQNCNAMDCPTMPPLIDTITAGSAALGIVGTRMLLCNLLGGGWNVTAQGGCSVPTGSVGDAGNPAH